MIGESIPHEVEAKLQRSGVQVTRDEWQSFPRAARQRLIDAPASSRIEQESLATLVLWLCRTFGR